ERRREVQAVMDRLNSEIGNRYSQGSASVDELLDSERGQSDPSADH
ncbi:MAG: aerial mycelium formation protein, partial [Sciscionella sp.]